MTSFGIYYHSRRGQWQARYRTRVERSVEFPRGTACVHLGFALTKPDAVILRNEWIAETFGSLGPSGTKCGGLVDAWNMRAHGRRESKKAVLERILAGRGSSTPPLTGDARVDNEVKNVLDILEKEPDDGDE